MPKKQAPKVDPNIDPVTGYAKVVPTTREPDFNLRTFLSGDFGYGSESNLDKRISTAQTYTQQLQEDNPTKKTPKALFEGLSNSNLNRNVRMVDRKEAPTSLAGRDFYYTPADDTVHTTSNQTPKTETAAFNDMYPRPIDKAENLESNGYVVDRKTATKADVKRGIDQYVNRTTNDITAHELGHAVQRPLNYNGAAQREFEAEARTEEHGIDDANGRFTGMVAHVPHNHESLYPEFINSAAELQRHMHRQGTPLDDKPKADAYIQGILNLPNGPDFEKQIQPLPTDAQRMFRNLMRMKTNGEPGYHTFLHTIINTIPALVNNNPTATSIFA